MNQKTCFLIVARMRDLSRPESAARPGDKNFHGRHRSQYPWGFQSPFSCRPKFCISRATQEPVSMRVSVALDKLTSYDVVAVQAANDISRIDPLCNHNRSRK